MSADDTMAVLWTVHEVSVAEAGQASLGGGHGIADVQNSSPFRGESEFRLIKSNTIPHFVLHLLTQGGKGGKAGTQAPAEVQFPIKTK